MQGFRADQILMYAVKQLKSFLDEGIVENAIFF